MFDKQVKMFENLKRAAIFVLRMAMCNIYIPDRFSANKVLPFCIKQKP